MNQKAVPVIAIILTALAFLFGGYRAGSLESDVFQAVQWLFAGITIVFFMVQMANLVADYKKMTFVLVWTAIWIGLSVAQWIAGVFGWIEGLVHVVLGIVLFRIFYTQYKKIKIEA